MPLNQQVKMTASLLAAVIDEDYQGAMKLLLHYGGKDIKVILQSLS